MSDRRTLLRENFLLKTLSDDELDRMLRFASVQSHRAGDVLFRKGDPGEGMMAVLKGQIRIGVMSAEGKELIHNIINPGQVFGEIALLDGKERSADAVAIVPTDVLVVLRRDFLPFLEADAKLCIRLMTVLCEKLRLTSELAEDFMFLELRQRLAKRLVRLAQLYGRPWRSGVIINFRLPQRELAAMMGTSRESINKQLREWAEAGWLTVDRGNIAIHDLDAMTRQYGG
ncbi:MAG: Crp/Fnr family transcriptional regulator [Alphaproteobacteria bacterium]|nr:Crp/Fnr family transcriptional regulator [Alphaproteobacteria bacterium]